MNKNELKARIDRLRAEIEHHNRLYYTLAKPEISDYEYDMLVKELQELEAQYAEIGMEESPTQKVGSDLTPGAKTIPHKVRMASLEMLILWKRFWLLSIGQITIWGIIANTVRN